MCKNQRIREAVYRVWQKAFEDFQRRPATHREHYATALNALLTTLRRYDNADALVASYWEPGDWPAALLLEHLADALSVDALLDLEHVGFWLRYRELTGDA